MDFNSVDKSYFKCFRMENGSVYYGEVEYLNTETNTISVNYEELDEEAKGKHKRVRHGNGVQLFGTTEESLLCKYVGHWEKDEMSGKGTATLPDGSIYEGEFKNSLFEGSGRFTWPSGDVYSGNWRVGKMDGAGKYVNATDGNTYEGIFKRNFYNHENKAFIDPALTKSDAKDFLQKAAKHSAAQARKKDAFENRVRFYKCSSPQQLSHALNETEKAGRVPFILSNSLPKNQMYQYLKISSGRQEVHELDMRELYVEAISGPMKQENSIIAKKQAVLAMGKSKKAEKARQLAYLLEKGGDVFKISEAAYNGLHEIVVTALCQGDILLLNLDDSSVPYEELFDPDIREFYGVRKFPPQIWNKNEMLRREAWESYMGRMPDLSRIQQDEEEDEMEGAAEQVNENYMLALWSRMKLLGELTDEDCIEKFEKRFGKTVPMERVNLILIHNAQPLGVPTNIDTDAIDAMSGGGMD